MAENTVIAASVQVDTSLAAKQMSDLSKVIAEQKKLWKDSAIGTKEYEDAQKKLGEAQAEYNKIAKEHNETQGKGGEAFSILKDKIQGVIPGLKGAESGVSSLSMQFKALLANPIILILTGIVAALAFLYEAFTSTSAGANKMKEIFAGVSAVIENIANRAIHFGRAILEFLSGDFKGAANDYHEASDNIIGDMENTYKTAVKLKGERIKLNKEIKESELKTLMQKERLADLKAQLADENISAKEKIKIAQQLKEEQQKLSGILVDQEKKNKELSLKEVAEKYGVEGDLAIKVADLKEKLLKAETETEKEEIKKQISEFTLKAKNQSEFSSAVNDILKSNHETMKAINDEDRAVNKATKAANKQANAEAEAERKAAKEKLKAQRENDRAYEEKMLKYSQEQQIAEIKDAYEKELKQLEFKTTAELEVNKKALAEGKITKEQYHQLSLAEEQAFLTQRDALSRKHEDEIKKTEIEFQKQLADIKKQTDSSEETDLRKKELATLKADLEAKTKAILDNEKFTFDQKQKLLTALSNEQKVKEAALEKKFADEDIKARKEQSLKQIAFDLSDKKKSFNDKLDLLKQKKAIEDKGYADEIKAANGNAIKLADINLRKLQSDKAYGEAVKQIEKEKMAAYVAAADGIASTLMNGAKLLGEQTALGKAAAIASSTISMFTSAQKAYEATVGIPFVGPFLAPINAGLAIGVGIQNIQKIASVEVPGGGASGSTSISAPSAPIAPTQTSTSLDSKSIQGIGNAANGGAVRAYMTDSDYKNNAERNARINRAARLG